MLDHEMLAAVAEQIEIAKKKNPRAIAPEPAMLEQVPFSEWMRIGTMYFSVVRSRL